MHKVFVYGSLLSGLGNHGLLVNAKKLGESLSPPGFSMIDLGWFPGVFRNPESGTIISGEVYEVDDATLARLDRLEGYNQSNPKSGLYDREQIDTKFGKTYIYTYNHIGSHMGRIVDSGDWRKHITKKYENY